MRVTTRKGAAVAAPQVYTAILAVLLALWGFVFTETPHGPALPSLARPGSSLPLRPRTFAARAVQGASVAVPNCLKLPCIALTFDDGPQPQITPQVLDTLARHHVRATFFLIGLHVPGNEGLVQRMYHEGHEIGNHTWSHVDLTALPPAQVEDQVLRTQAVITAAGVPAPRLMRPPYGAINPMVRSHVPLTIALWNADPEDWKKTRGAQVVESVEAAAGPGKVIDMHDIKQPTADALDQILNDLQPKYQFVTVSELLDIAPGQPGVYFGR